MPRLVTKHISSRATHYIRCRPSHRPAVNIFNAVRGGRTCPATGASTRWWTSGWSRSGASSWRGPSPPTAWRGQMPRGHGLEIGAGREREREIERERARHVTSRHVTGEERCMREDLSHMRHFHYSCGPAQLTGRGFRQMVALIL